MQQVLSARHYLYFTTNNSAVDSIPFRIANKHTGISYNQRLWGRFMYKKSDVTRWSTQKLSDILTGLQFKEHTNPVVKILLYWLLMQTPSEARQFVRGKNVVFFSSQWRHSPTLIKDFLYTWRWENTAQSLNFRFFADNAPRRFGPSTRQHVTSMLSWNFGQWQSPKVWPLKISSACSEKNDNSSPGNVDPVFDH